MGRIPPPIIDQVLQRVDLVATVEGYTTLKRAGADFKACCPLPGHEEKTPSFVVHPRDQYFKCFGCGRGGTVIVFIQEMERLSFPEAVRFLAERHGIDIPQDAAPGPSRDDRQRCHHALAFARDFFVAALHGAGGQEACRYLADRGLMPSTVERFAIGLAPEGWDGLLNAARKRGIGAADLKLAGLARERPSDGGHYDFFRGRVMFPLLDAHERVIGFSGRILGPEQEGVGKYVNSPETPVFHKSDQLFGFAQARPAILQQRVAVLVEGQMDAIMAHQCGITNVVAPLGTALTAEQVRLLKRQADSVTLLFDPDEAGQKSAEGKLSLFLEAECEVRLASLPGTDDPAEFLSKRGSEAFQSILARAESPMAFKWRRAGLRYDLLSAQGRGAAVDEMLQLAALSPHGVKREALLDEIGALTHLYGGALRPRLQAFLAKKRRRGAHGDDARESEGEAAGSSPLGSSAAQRREQELLALLLEARDLAATAARRLPADAFSDPVLRALFEQVIQAPRAGEPLAAFLAGVENPDLADAAVGLHGRFQVPRDLDRYLDDCLLAMEREHARRQAESHRDLLRDSDDALRANFEHIRRAKQARARQARSRGRMESAQSDRTDPDPEQTHRGAPAKDERA